MRQLTVANRRDASVSGSVAALQRFDLMGQMRTNALQQMSWPPFRLLETLMLHFTEIA